MKVTKDKPVILSDGTPLDPAKKIGIFDAAGQQLPYVYGFDTETCEIEMMIKLRDETETDDGEKLCYFVRNEDMKPLVAKFILPGAFIMTEDGQILGDKNENKK